MAYPKKGKTTKLKPIGRPALADLSDDYKEAIINHEQCYEIFKEKAANTHLSVTEDSECIISAFNKLLPELSDNELNISEGEKEYKPLFELLTGNFVGEYPVNTGLFMLMMNLIRKKAGKLSCDSITERLNIFIACDKVAAEMQALLIPIRDNCVSDFYENCTQEQWDEVRDMVKHRNNPQAHGMPGNQGVPQYRR